MRRENLQYDLPEDIKKESPDASAAPEHELHNQEIADLRRPMKALLAQLRGNIDKGEYSLLVGDDASGRIPALIFKKVLDAIYNKHGHTKAQAVFFAGGRTLYEKGVNGLNIHDEQEREEHEINEITSEIQKQRTHKADKLNYLKALLVTEIIDTGTSLETITTALKRADVDFDIASVALLVGNRPYPPHESAHDMVKRIGGSLGGQIYYGQESEPAIQDKSHLSGVIREPRNIHASSVIGKIHRDWNKRGKLEKLLTYHRQKRQNSDIQKKINIARNDIDILSDDLVAWYNKDSQV